MGDKMALAALRVNAGLTQEELAQKVGVSSRTIVVYENDSKKLGDAKYSTLRRIAMVLNCSVDNIFLD